MRVLIGYEIQEVAGAYAAFGSMGSSNSPYFEVTEDAVYQTGHSIYNKVFNPLAMQFFSNRVEDAAGNIIFSGHSGNFCYGGIDFHLIKVLSGTEIVGNRYVMVGFC